MWPNVTVKLARPDSGPLPTPPSHDAIVACHCPVCAGVALTAPCQSYVILLPVIANGEKETLTVSPSRGKREKFGRSGTIDEDQVLRTEPPDESPNVAEPCSKSVFPSVVQVTV